MNRISTRYQYNNNQAQIRQAQSRLYELSQEVATGKRSNLLKNDPTGASYVIRSSALKTATEQYDKNLRTGDDYLKNSEAALSELHDLMTSAKLLATQAASDAVDQPARVAMVTQVTQLQKRIVDLANTQGNSGQYIFAGQKNNQVPYTISGTTLVYNGDANSINIETGRGQTMAVNSKSSSIFVAAYADLETLKNDLTSGNIPLLSGQDIQNISTRLDSVRLERGNVGTRLQTVADLSSQNKRRIDDLTSRISDVEEVDMAEAIANYQLAETAYQAALQTTALTNKLSLMDFIS